MRRCFSAISLLGALVACTPAATPTQAAAPAEPAAAQNPNEHDFGVVPHGEVRTHTFSLEVPGGPNGQVAIGFRSGCTCGTARFLIRRGGGEVQDVDGLPFQKRRIQPGDELLLELTIDTRREEAVDRPAATVRGTAILQVDDQGTRANLDVVYHYAIDAPVEVRPAVHVDIGALARSRSYSQSVELRVDPKFAPIAFRGVETSHPRLHAELREAGGRTLVDLRFAPTDADPIGPVEMEIRVETDMPNGYVMSIPVSGAVTDDITVEPFDHISFGRFDFGAPMERFVNVFDHNRDRDPGFAVAAITDDGGASLEEHFEVRLETVGGTPSCTRMHLRYLGKWEQTTFRGLVRLTKPDGSKVTEITFVGFHKEP